MSTIQRETSTQTRSNQNYFTHATRAVIEIQRRIQNDPIGNDERVAIIAQLNELSTYISTHERSFPEDASRYGALCIALLRELTPPPHGEDVYEALRHSTDRTQAAQPPTALDIQDVQPYRTSLGQRIKDGLSRLNPFKKRDPSGEVAFSNPMFDLARRDPESY